MSKKVCNKCKSAVKDSDKFCPKSGSEVVAANELKKEKVSKNKETKEYMFEPVAYTSMGNTYNGRFSL